MKPGQCTGAGIPTSENRTETFNSMSTLLQNNTGKAMEMWLYKEGGSGTKQIRIITPDSKYFCQAAIDNGKLWIELYTLLPTADGVDITLSNHAVADVSAALPMEGWNHLVVQSATSLTTGDLQLYLDGKKLTKHSPVSSPPYPFDWEINSAESGFLLPVEDIAVLKHFRMYNRTATDAEVLANYKNSCLNPVDALAANTNPLLLWGRFNIPDFCNSTAETTSIPNSGSPLTFSFSIKTLHILMLREV